MFSCKLEDALNVHDLRVMARARLPKWMFEFVDRGTEDEVALRNNRAAFERIKLKTQVLVDVSKRNQEVTLAVSAGKVDAGLSDVDTLAEVTRANPDLVPFGMPIFSSPVAAGFPKENTELRRSFNAFLRGLREDGTYAEMVDRWMTQRSTRMPSLPAPPVSGVLTIGISTGGFPFSAVENNDLAGFDVELGRRFAAHVGREEIGRAHV